MTQLPTQPQQQTQTRTAESELDRLMEKPVGIEKKIVASKEEFAKAGAIDADKFVRIALNFIRGDDRVMQCEQRSVMLSLMKCAQYGLLPDGRQALINCYGKEAKFQLCSIGAVILMERHYPGAQLTRGCVYEGDVFREWTDDTGRHFIHERTHQTSDTNKITHAYAQVILPNGARFSEVMTRSDIVRRQKKAKTAGVWSEWWEQMGMKTVILQLIKTLPSIDIKEDFDDDDEAPPVKRQTLESMADAIIQEPAPPREPGDDENE